MLVFLGVGIRYEVPVELEVHQDVLVIEDPGDGEMVEVPPLLRVVPGLRDLPLVSRVEEARTDDTMSLKIILISETQLKRFIILRR